MPIAIVGAGRSGTSMVARMLNLCGVDLGDEEDLAHPNPMNEKGVWESPGFLSVNDRICAYLKKTHGTQYAPPPGWHNDPALEPIYADARQLIESMFSSKTNWAFKDALASFTIPFWRKILPDLKVVVCVRNPIDFARSASDWYFGNRSLAFAHWHVTYLTIYSEIAPQDTAPALYEELVADYREPFNCILGYLQLPKVEADTEQDKKLRAFIDRGLKHHSSTVDDLMKVPGIPNPVRRLYADFAANGSESPVLAQQLADRDELMSMWKPVMEMMSDVYKFAQIQERNMEYQQILNSRTHRLATSVCKVLIRFSEFKKSLRRAAG